MAACGRSLLRLAVLTMLAAITLLVDPVVQGRGFASAQGVQNVPDDDPGMLAAYARAKATLPGFWERVARPEPGERFSVKLRYATRAGNDELIWANDPELNGDLVSAVIDNEPRDIEGLKIGDRVAVPVNRVVDWIIVRQGKMHGGFTIRALLPHMPPEEAAELRRMLAPE